MSESDQLSKAEPQKAALQAVAEIQATKDDANDSALQYCLYLVSHASSNQLHAQSTLHDTSLNLQCALIG